MSSTLVTGGNGFLAGWTIAALLDQGHHVRTTVRNLGQEQVLRRRISTVAGAGERIDDRTADLMSDDG